MSNLSVRKPYQPSGTSALGAMQHHDNYRLVASKLFLTLPSTATTGATLAWDLLAAMEMTTSGSTLPSASSTEVTPEAVYVL